MDDRFEEIADRWENLIKDSQTLLEEVRAIKADISKQAVLDNPLDNYIYQYSYGTMYWLDHDSNIESGTTIFREKHANPYCNYPSRIYAEKAARLKLINDITLAWKWCYERDVEVDWHNSVEMKWFVIYDNEREVFSVDGTYDVRVPSIVYFMHREFAASLCRWLNSDKGWGIYSQRIKEEPDE